MKCVKLRWRHQPEIFVHISFPTILSASRRKLCVPFFERQKLRFVNKKKILMAILFIVSSCVQSSFSPLLCQVTAAEMVACRILCFASSLACDSMKRNGCSCVTKYYLRFIWNPIYDQSDYQRLHAREHAHTHQTVRSTVGVHANWVNEIDAHAGQQQRNDTKPRITSMSFHVAKGHQQ